MGNFQLSIFEREISSHNWRKLSALMIEQAHCVGCRLADSFVRCEVKKASHRTDRLLKLLFVWPKIIERYLWSQRGKEVGFNLSHMQYQDGKASMLGVHKTSDIDLIMQGLYVVCPTQLNQAESNRVKAHSPRLPSSTLT